MQKQFLLPYKYKRTGWLIIYSGIIFFFLIVLGTFLFAPWGEILQIGQKKQLSELGKYFFNATPFLLITLGSLLIGGMLLVAFSKEKTEDEFIIKLRKSAFLNAVLYNYVSLMLLYVYSNEPSFLKFFIYSIFNVLALYILDFHIRLNYPDILRELENKLK